MKTFCQNLQTKLYVKTNIDGLFTGRLWGNVLHIPWGGRVDNAQRPENVNAFGPCTHQKHNFIKHYSATTADNFLITVLQNVINKNRHDSFSRSVAQIW